MRFLLVGFICFIFLSVLPGIVLGQPGGGGPGGGGPPVPITGIEILLGAGALLGARRFIGNRKNKN